MRIKLLLTATIAAILATATPPASTRAHAASRAWCGTALVAGIALCITWDMKLSEYRRLIIAANAGDRDAALTLAQFEDERTDKVSNGAKWWRRAAQLGECQALRKLRDDDARIGNASVAAHWRGRIARNRCAAQVDGERWMGGR